jgi:hypothetical protein
VYDRFRPLPAVTVIFPFGVLAVIFVPGDIATSFIAGIGPSPIWSSGIGPHPGIIARHAIIKWMANEYALRLLIERENVFKIDDESPKENRNHRRLCLGAGGMD